MISNRAIASAALNYTVQQISGGAAGSP